LTRDTIIKHIKNLEGKVDNLRRLYGTVHGKDWDLGYYEGKLEVWVMTLHLYDNKRGGD